MRTRPLVLSARRPFQAPGCSRTCDSRRVSIDDLTADDGRRLDHTPTLELWPGRSREGVNVSLAFDLHRKLDGLVHPCGIGTHDGKDSEPTDCAREPCGRVLRRRTHFDQNGDTLHYEGSFRRAGGHCQHAGFNLYRFNDAWKIRSYATR